MEITIVKTEFQHNDMRDTGSEEAEVVDRVPCWTSSSPTPTPATAAAPVETSATAPPKILDPGPVAPYVPVGNEAKPVKSLTR